MLNILQRKFSNAHYLHTVSNAGIKLHRDGINHGKLLFVWYVLSNSYYNFEAIMKL
jgi:hypothetical protein